MKQLPASIILEKNKLATASAFLIFLDIVLNDEQQTTLRFVNNTENVTFQGNEYTAFPFVIDTRKEGAKGEIPAVVLRVSNVSRVLQAYLEDLKGAVGSQVKLTVVNSAYLSEDYSELEMTFDVLSTASDTYWVSFTLGAPNPLRQRFPLYRYIADHCPWDYKSIECGYYGSLESCERTLDDCRVHNNSGRFGGYIGLKNKGVRVA